MGSCSPFTKLFQNGVPTNDVAFPTGGSFARRGNLSPICGRMCSHRIQNGRERQKDVAGNCGRLGDTCQRGGANKPGPAEAQTGRRRYGEHLIPTPLGTRPRTLRSHGCQCKIHNHGLGTCKNITITCATLPNVEKWLALCLLVIGPNLNRWPTFGTS